MSEWLWGVQVNDKSDKKTYYVKQKSVCNGNHLHKSGMGSENKNVLNTIIKVIQEPD